ncbi:NAD(P)-dependent oxidoreductase [Slackia piriformis]|nr:NAD(P)-dependent oxidoreductase [Slackia piriformis]
MTSKGIVWVTGCRGFLGGEMVERFERAGYNVVGTDVELSVCEPERLEAFAEEVQPSIVVNCAGIRREATTLSTRVKAYEVNALGARNVALAANTVGSTIVQVSSDDVYSAKLDEPVNEFDSPEPDTPYGKSKRAGEMMVRNTTNDHIIVRSSWLYHASSGRMKAILDAAREGGTIEVRTDQFAAPTSVSLYADLIFRALDKGATGTFHIVSRGRASRYDFAAKILEYAGYDPEKVLIPVEDPRTAENIVLESMLLDIAGIELPTWEDDLKRYMEEQGLLA